MDNYSNNSDIELNTLSDKANKPYRLLNGT